MRLIDERELIRRISELPDLRMMSTATIGKIIKECSTIDAEPVRHGQWIPVKVCSVETKFKCSECNRTIIVCNDYFGRATELASSEYPYCHCGAKMDAEEEIL